MFYLKFLPIVWKYHHKYILIFLWLIAPPWMWRRRHYCGNKDNRCHVATSHGTLKATWSKGEKKVNLHLSVQNKWNPWIWNGQGTPDVKHQGGFNSIAKPMLKGEGTNQKCWHDFLNAQKNGLKNLTLLIMMTMLWCVNRAPQVD
jgi:hypothetical protein